MSARAASSRVQPSSGSRSPPSPRRGRRAPAIRFGDPRVQALAGALCTSVLAVTGITNKSLRALMTGLLGGANYAMTQASYDLARLARNGLITRIPGRNSYRLTGDGLRFAIFYSKLHDRAAAPAASPPTDPKHRPKSTLLYAPSTGISINASPTPGSLSQPETRLKCRIPTDKGSLPTKDP